MPRSRAQHYAVYNILSGKERQTREKNCLLHNRNRQLLLYQKISVSLLFIIESIVSASIFHVVNPFKRTVIVDRYSAGAVSIFSDI